MTDRPRLMPPRVRALGDTMTTSPAVIYRCPRCGLFFGVSAALHATARGIGCTDCPPRVAYVRADVAAAKTKKESKA